MYIENLKIKKNISIWLISMFYIISFMIIVGGLTRLTDSGLSITEWQLFSGFLPPFNSDDWNNYFNLTKDKFNHLKSLDLSKLLKINLVIG